MSYVSSLGKQTLIIAFNPTLLWHRKYGGKMIHISKLSELDYVDNATSILALWKCSLKCSLYLWILYKCNVTRLAMHANWKKNFKRNFYLSPCKVMVLEQSIIYFWFVVSEPLLFKLYSLSQVFALKYLCFKIINLRIKEIINSLCGCKCKMLNWKWNKQTCLFSVCLSSWHDPATVSCFQTIPTDLGCWTIIVRELPTRH